MPDEAAAPRHRSVRASMPQPIPTEEGIFAPLPRRRAPKARGGRASAAGPLPWMDLAPGLVMLKASPYRDGTTEDRRRREIVAPLPPVLDRSIAVYGYRSVSGRRSSRAAALSRASGRGFKGAGGPEGAGATTDPATGPSPSGDTRRPLPARMSGGGRMVRCSSQVIASCRYRYVLSFFRPHHLRQRGAYRAKGFVEDRMPSIVEVLIKEMPEEGEGLTASVLSPMIPSVGK